MTEPSSVPHVTALVRAEVDKLATRTSARLALASMVLLGVGVPLMIKVVGSLIQVNTVGAGAGPELHVGSGMAWVLGFRNFFVFRAMLIAVVAVSFAGEFVDRTLREDLVRPVSRSTVLFAKWAALQVLVVLGSLVPLIASALVGLPLLGVGDVTAPLIGYALTALGDVGFATFVMALSIAIRSVPGTIGGVFLYWVVDRAFGWFLSLLEVTRPMFESAQATLNVDAMLPLIDAAIAIRPWLPSAAFDVYWDFEPGEPLVWQSWVALAFITTASYAAAAALFSRLDVD